MHPTPRSHRPLIMGRRGAVASNHPMATQAGLDVLRAGGNALDATIAVSLILGVVEPHMSGLGGDGFFQVLGTDGQGFCVNATGAAPAAATPEAYAAGIPVSGPRSASIPGLVGGLALLHGKGARLPWARLVAPAIEAARDGFAVTHAYAHFAGENRAKLAADPLSKARLLVEEAGALVTQPELAASLTALAEGGAEAFYRGALAARLAAGIAAAGGPVGAADLAGCTAEIVAPLEVPYRGFVLRQTPPNSTGFTFLQIMRMLERFDLAALGRDSAALIHLMVEAKKRAFRDREAHGADPRGRDIPLGRLLSAEYAAAEAAAIDPGRAASLPLKPRPGGGDTTYFCVVDAAGNAVSAIQSINSAFGSGSMAGETGVLMNNRMAYWHLEAGHPNRLRPGLRVRHTMNAPLVLKDGKLWAVFGTPGADNQVQINAQILVGMADFGLDPQQAVEAPRWTSSQYGQPANYPHDGDDVLTLEAGLAPAADALRAMGHAVKLVPPLDGPCSVAAIRLLANGVRVAGSDPRRDGWAAAF